MDSLTVTEMAAAGSSRAASPHPDDSVSVAPRRPLTSPSTPRLYSRFSSREALTTGTPAQPRFFRSRRITKDQINRPWLDTPKSRKEKLLNYIPLIGVALGIAVAGFLVYDGLSSVSNFTYCPVLIEDFSSGVLDPSVWTKEVEVGGYGNGQFEETTGTDENAFIQDGQLYIKPTLQDASLITTNNTINLLKLGTCTSTTWANCVATTNTTNGTIVNPVKSARINTKKGAAIKYGRVEVTAKLPAGDWLWPAIWLLPSKDTYGVWPASGEIDIAESRGNNYTYPQGGNQVISSTLHWGPNSDDDRWYLNNVKRSALHSTYSDAFHTFGLEWSEKYLFTFIDSRLIQVMYVKFNEPLWQRGDFSAAAVNFTELVDPWSQTGRDSTPFDEDFYLILNVAVGGTNGWFDDGVAGKPWVDGATNAKQEFWNARDQWYPTWESGGGQMIVSSVKIYQQKGYNGC